MTIKHKVLQAHLKEWLACRGNKVARGILTTQLAELLRMHKKSIPRAMKRLQMKRRAQIRRQGRPVLYGADVTAALVKVWEAMECPCAELMTPTAIDTYVAYFMEEHDWQFSVQTTHMLLMMSEGTKKSRIRSFRRTRGLLRGRTATVSSPLKGIIPIRKSHTWADLGVGYVQTDTVVHCGDMLTGDVVYSIGCVDVATYWSVYTAQWNKGQEATRASLETLRGYMPFPVRELHPDTGNEFINYHVYGWAKQEGIAMTRSEPSKKNDNMCIEERNDTVARRHLGYERMDDVSLVPYASEVLRISCLLNNHFRPVRRMVSKVRIGARWKRTFEKRAKTPYERVLERDDVSDEDKENLRAVHATQNPLALKRELDRLKEVLRKKRAALLTNR